ncbi:excinuclease ABC subunit UvrB [Thermoproteota archaeon]
MSFQLISDYQPAGDQPKAINSLVQGITNNNKHQILLGVTGSGKTYTIANMIAQLNRPALVIAHNKTLAAQLCGEFREFFPNNAVEFFISYYDYYQPEAYIASRDVYIEKEADINEEIERLRHHATHSVLTRRDVIIVASVSCIYGLGSPEDYMKGAITLKKGDVIARKDLLLKLDHIQYERNDTELKQGRYRIKGEIIDIFPSYEERLIRLEFFGQEIERISTIHPITGDTLSEQTETAVYPATHYVVDSGLATAILEIRKELDQQINMLQSQGKPLEAHRLKQRTLYDIEMMQELGYCKGIENYSRHIDSRKPGEPPGVLLDFFPPDFITIIDESHVTVPQVRGMYAGDRSRKKNLIDYGFRLPSAMDNRPLMFEEFSRKTGQCVYVSATPGSYELTICGSDPQAAFTEQENPLIVQQIIRPTGLVDPQVVVKSTVHQIDDLLTEIHAVIFRNERVLVTTLTKRMAEDLCGFLDDKGIKTKYLHSEVPTLDRIDILHDLRLGIFDVLVGVNLLREGLDLPEVSLVAIMDADKEGFLRNERSLIQTIGRAARNLNGKVIMYADKLTDSMSRAVKETNRRRTIQLAYNKDHGIKPQTIIRKVTDIREDARKAVKEASIRIQSETIAPDKLPSIIAELEKQMFQAAKNLEFELAAVIRDQLEELKNLSQNN